MSADNGYIIRKNDEGQFVLQMYFASSDDYPDINKASLKFPTLADACEFYAKQDYYSEYGLSIQGER